jgi:hypothetical protein
MNVLNFKTGDLHEVIKYVKSQSDGEESVWCNGWYGRHIIGKDCAFIKSYQLNTTKPTLKNELVIPEVIKSVCDDCTAYPFDERGKTPLCDTCKDNPKQTVL